MEEVKHQTKKSASPKLLTALLLIGVFVIVPIWLTHSPEAAKQPAYVPLTLGEKIVLDKEILVFESQEIFDRATSCSNAKYNECLDEMRSKGQILMLSASTTVQVDEVSTLFPKIKIIDGAFTGKIGFTPVENIVKTKL